MPTSSQIHIGTSGWNYDHWQGTFYPEDRDSRQSLLQFYAEHFRTVEVNNSFYQLPTVATFHTWYDSTPDDFLFAVKASRYITHMKKLKDPEEHVQKFLQRVETLDDKLGPVLFQLPPRWHLNLDRLTAFLDVLPQNFRYTFEFRDHTWFDSNVYDLLQERGAAWCIYDLKGELSPKEVTSDFVYVRLHGPQEQAYTGKYSKESLSGWAGAFSSWKTQGKKIFCYFDNDEQGFAPHNALELQDMLST